MWFDVDDFELLSEINYSRLCGELIQQRDLFREGLLSRLFLMKNVFTEIIVDLHGCNGYVITIFAV